MNNSLIEILGRDRVEEIKDAIKDILIENVKEDLSHDYLVEMGSFRELGDLIIEEIRQEVKEEFKARLKEKIEKELEEKFLK